MDYKEKLQVIIESAKKSKSYCKQTMILTHKNVCVYGLGKLFEDTFESRKIKELFRVNYLCDSNPDKAKMYSGGEVKVVAPQDLRQIEDLIVILMFRNTAELEKQLMAWGIPYVRGFELLLEMSLGEIVTQEEFESNDILKTYDLLEERSKETWVELLANRLAPECSTKSYRDLYCPNQYFNQVFFPVTNSECFVDCGAYIGDTIQAFLDVAGDVEEIHSFEIDDHNYDEIKKYVNSLPKQIQDKIALYHAGVWREHKMMGYGNEEKSDQGAYSLLKTDRRGTVCVEQLDDILKDRPVSLVKMDIEGAELPALQGAAHIIQSKRPKLAICIYHKIGDFWKIPMFIHLLVPEYRFGVLHHSASDIETVLYAWVDER